MCQKLLGLICRNILLNIHAFGDGPVEMFDKKSKCVQMESVLLAPAFLFFDEIGLLALQVEELEDIVDYWIVIEASTSFIQTKRTLVLEQILKFAAMEHASIPESIIRNRNRIIYIPVVFPPHLYGFDCERYLREQTLVGVSRIHELHPSATVITSIADVDELISKESLLS